MLATLSLLLAVSTRQAHASSRGNTCKLASGTRQLRLLFIGESCCEVSPALQQKLRSEVKCPVGFDCKLTIDCNAPRALEENLQGFAHADSPRRVLARECSSVEPPHIVLIQMGCADAAFNPKLESPAGAAPIATAIQQWAACAWSVTLATANPIQDGPAFCSAEAQKKKVIQARHYCKQESKKVDNLNAGLQSALAQNPPACPQADFLNIDKAVWDVNDYSPPDQLHYCTKGATCGTAVRLGAILAKAFNAKLQLLADRLEAEGSLGYGPKGTGKVTTVVHDPKSKSLQEKPLRHKPIARSEPVVDKAGRGATHTDSVISAHGSLSRDS